MRPGYERPRAEESGVSLGLRRGVPYACETRSELGPRMDAELAVGAGEIRLHGLRAHVELRRDLAIGQTGRRELCDAAFGFREPARGVAQSDAGELGACLLGPERCAELLEADQRALERMLRRGFPLRPPLDLALGEQRAAELEGHRETLVLYERA